MECSQDCNKADKNQWLFVCNWWTSVQTILTHHIAAIIYWRTDYYVNQFIMLCSEILIDFEIHKFKYLFIYFRIFNLILSINFTGNERSASISGRFNHLRNIPYNYLITSWAISIDGLHVERTEGSVLDKSRTLALRSVAIRFTDWTFRVVNLHVFILKNLGHESECQSYVGRCVHPSHTCKLANPQKAMSISWVIILRFFRNLLCCWIHLCFWVFSRTWILYRRQDSSC